MYIFFSRSQKKNNFFYKYFTIFSQGCKKLRKIVRKLKETRIFFWKKRYFFYNHRMSNFKIRKLPKEQIIVTKNIEDQVIRTKRRLRIFVGFLICIFWGFFAFNLIAQSIWSIRIGTNEVVFTPIKFTLPSTIPKPEETKNILIAGIGWEGHEGSSLTDSIMLARVDEKNKKITLLSLPRDLYVAYQWWKTAGRINALYGMNIWDTRGINLLAQKVSEITWQSIDHYMVIDFTGFKYIVNALGWIDLDVPKDVVDHEYPDNNWWYTTFVVRRWVQTFDWETALRYARSRHSTSDFDRSERQQLLIKAIKDKALSLDFLTSPAKIQDVLSAIRSHLDTDLTVSDIISFGWLMKDLSNEDINVYWLWNSCVALNCAVWSYLYNPAREYFNGASVLIPENAAANKLSYYNDIIRFTWFIFEYPTIRNNKIPLVIVHSKSNYQQARNIAIALRKLGFNFDNEWLFFESTGSIDSSHINVYRNDELDLGWKSDSLIMNAFRSIEEKIPYITTIHNEYVITDGPKIEIVLGKDSSWYFTFSKPAYYLPYIPSTSSWEIWSGSVVSWEWWQKKWTTKKKSVTPVTNESSSQSEYSIAPWEWEDFNQ